jgi:glycosyltransferase involved in cell wall biosynthesis
MTAASDFSGTLRRYPRPYRSTITQRVHALVAAIGAEGGDGSVESAFVRVAEYVASGDHSRVWLVQSALTAKFPVMEDVIEASRLVVLGGEWEFLRGLILPTGARSLATVRAGRPIEIIRQAVVVDVDHTSRVDFATGIQRVVRETVRRWNDNHGLIAVGWTRDRTALRRLDPLETRKALTGTADGAVPKLGWRTGTALIPFESTFIAAELNIEARSVQRVAALARFAAGRTGTIGFDQVPITSSETTDGGMPSAFALTLAAVKWMDSVAAISSAAAEEYSGWKDMLAAIGLPGPRIDAIPLPVEAPEAPTGAAREEASALLREGSRPLVLCVGSHEPRKNHLAILHSAELLWREGVDFSLAFVGGNSWNSREFDERAGQLIEAGRPIRTVRALPDELLWAAYAVSYVVLFPSLNEGYGLPVAEALASGTPVITGKFGSTAEIAAAGGALLVDPRNDAEITDALRRVLASPELRAELAAQAVGVPRRTWGDYAEETWNILVAGDPSA